MGHLNVAFKIQRINTLLGYSFIKHRNKSVKCNNREIRNLTHKQILHEFNQ